MTNRLLRRCGGQTGGRRRVGRQRLLAADRDAPRHEGGDRRPRGSGSGWRRWPHRSPAVPQRSARPSTRRSRLPPQRASGDGSATTTSHPSPTRSRTMFSPSAATAQPEPGWTGIPSPGFDCHRVARIGAANAKRPPTESLVRSCRGDRHHLGHGGMRSRRAARGGSPASRSDNDGAPATGQSISSAGSAQVASQLVGRIEVIRIRPAEASTAGGSRGRARHRAARPLPVASRPRGPAGTPPLRSASRAEIAQPETRSTLNHGWRNRRVADERVRLAARLGSTQ